MIHQELALVDDLTVAENIFLGDEPRHGWCIDWTALLTATKEVLERFHFHLDPELKVRQLGIGQKQLVEIARALSKESRILILDEPTAALSNSEVNQLMQILRQLRQCGVACIYISHKLDEVKEIADRITVLRDGETVVTMEAKDASTSDMIHHMVGREISELYPRRISARRDKIVLAVERLSAASRSHQSVRLQNISFSVRAGEVLGIGGLMGAGRSELLMHLYGLWGKRLGGNVSVLGQCYPFPSPRKSLRRGLVLITEDRKRYGLVLDQSVGWNVSLSSLQSITQHGLVSRVEETIRNAPMLDKLGVRKSSYEKAVCELSGGNQQKVVLSRNLLSDPEIVLLDEPTRGIDVASKLEIYDEINQLVAEDKAVVLVSSELPELIGMSDRIVMLHEGRIAGEFDRDQFRQETLMAAATGSELPSHSL